MGAGAFCSSVAGEETAKNADTATDKEEPDSEQEQRSFNNGLPHRGDLRPNPRGNGAKTGHKSGQAGSLCQNHTFLKIFITGSEDPAKQVNNLPKKHQGKGKNKNPHSGIGIKNKGQLTKNSIGYSGKVIKNTLHSLSPPGDKTEHLSDNGESGGKKEHQQHSGKDIGHRLITGRRIAKQR